MKKIEWHLLPTKGVANGTVVVWREDRIISKEVIKKEFTISCLFKNYNSGLVWAFIGVYYKGSREERSGLWMELEECKNKWAGKWVIGGDFKKVLNIERDRVSNLM